MSDLILTVVAPEVNIRRGPTGSAGMIQRAPAGTQFKVINVVDLKAPEQWAKVRLDDAQDVDAYVCVKMPSGKALCKVQASPSKASDGEYLRGYRDGIDKVLQLIAAERAKLG
ncbi:MAG: hypothetical protein CVU44_11260 [Chloroflexi bacterium HGW-Chloroflexi-6]|nr:MAG: hypothetical protein CVU44_11260 [Chloroflexi bacterium HGW-Chloroflexi-6]